MRTSIHLSEDLIAEARRVTKIQQKTALVHAGLRALIAQASRERLLELQGTAPALRPIRRRRLPSK